jgi:hypothetical protein
MNQSYQTKKLLAGKKLINTMKRQPTEREKIFAIHSSNKRLISRTYKELNTTAKKKII